MDRALWFLLRLRFVAWGRRIARGLQGIKGVLLVAFGMVMLSLLVISAVTQPVHRVDPETLRLYGTGALLAYCVMVVLTSVGEPAVTFSAAEVDFLFPGPFSRRELLAYKILGSAFSSLITAGFMLIWLGRYAHSLLAAFLAVMLVLNFLQLFSMAVAMFSGLMGARAFNIQRKVILFVLTVAIVVAIGHWLQVRQGQGPIQWMAAAEKLPIFRLALAPLRWFTEVFAARRIWPDLVTWASCALLVNLIMVLVVFLLDVQFLEASAAQSERHYARLQRMRSGGVLAGRSGTGKARWGLGEPPVWGGMGPLAWRQMLALMRNLRGVIVFLAMFILFGMGPAFMRSQGRGSGAAIALFFIPMMTLFMLPRLTFDFRGDIDRMDVLKTLPLPPWRLVVGQLITPVLIVSFVQVLVIIVMLVGGAARHVGWVAAMVVPFNFVATAIENLVFLWFPVRAVPTMAVDVQFMGRQWLFFAMKMLMLLAAGGVASMVGTIVYFGTGRNMLPTLISAWIVLGIAGALLVPVVARAFVKFDVTRDTPA
ncbi:MAG TPA: putative ABC exporter domain-containing protein [Tepidisphaeraceae bacterium]|jgi:hypothetical protein|nr:putative ABC exporter domain-containing protein [Tepidisphaeraceae bacterium]